MVLTALTVTTTTETTHLSGSSDSLEKRFQRDVNYLFMGCKLSAEVTCESNVHQHQPTRHIRNARLRWLPFLGPFDMPLIPPPTLGRGCQRGSEPAASTAPALSFQQGVPPCVRAGGERRARFPRWPGRGARSTAPAAARAGRAERSSAAEGSLPSGCSCRWEQGSRTEPYAGVPWRCGVTAALAQPARPRPRHSRAAALPGAGGDVSPAPVPPLSPPGAARSNSHGNPGSTPFPNPASAPRPAAPARRPPAVGNSPCVNSTCPERCAPLPASLRARPRGAPAESDVGPFLQRGRVR